MNITCPNCAHQFLLDDAIDKEKMEELRKEVALAQQHELEKEKHNLREQMNAYVAQKEEENKLAEAKRQADLKQAEEAMMAKIKLESQAKLKFLEEENANKDAQLKQAQQNELDLMRLQKQILEVTQNAEHEKEKALLANEQKVREQFENELLPKMLEAKDLAMKEKDTQLESMKKTIEQLKQKSEQGSMQAQGEALELLLEELLRSAFPFDDIAEVGKGIRGADCIQTVRNSLGHACGTILFESKRTKAFENDWIEKLKTDARQIQADVAVIVTQVLPKDIKIFGQKDGVWICSFSHAAALVTVLRAGIIKVAETKKGEENKGEKMAMLYHFLTSNEFMQHMEAMLEGYSSLREGIVKERMQMEKIWKEREKQLDKVLINTSGLWGSIKGIAGGSMGNIRLLEGGEE
jgi:hypothetical protein